MTDRLLALVLEEGKWLFGAMLVSALSVVALLGRQRRKGLPRRAEILWALCLFYGCMIGIMAFGHLLAVTVKSFQGTLSGSLSALVPLGLALGIPAFWLVLHSSRVRHRESWRSKTTALNAWLGVCLLGGCRA